MFAVSRCSAVVSRKKRLSIVFYVANAQKQEAMRVRITFASSATVFQEGAPFMASEKDSAVLEQITKTNVSRCSAVGSAPVSGTCGLLFNQGSAKTLKSLENTELFALHQLRKNGQNSGLTT